MKPVTAFPTHAEWVQEWEWECYRTLEKTIPMVLGEVRQALVMLGYAASSWLLDNPDR